MRTAVLQMCTTEDVAQNWVRFEQLLDTAISEGAEWVITPENTFFLGPQLHKISMAQSIDGEWVQRCQNLAREYRIYLTIGSIPEIDVLPSGEVNPDQCYNTLVTIGPDGAVLEVYRKIHLFDVDIPGGMTIRESDRVIAGDRLSVHSLGELRVGNSICYDLRFGGLYQAMVDQGANVLLVPSAFTQRTGEAHWHILLRARAIENQSWVLAPGQTGGHDDTGNRFSYGHSLIIDPWGRVVADAGTQEGVIVADITLKGVEQVRAAIPVQEHRRW